MGWTFSVDWEELNPLEYETLEDAIEYCNKRGLSYYIEKPNLWKLDKKSYADNFKWKGPE